MTLEGEVVDWVLAMRNAGASDATIILLLQARGWTESDAIKALEYSYTKQIGIEPPKPSKVSKVYPRDAFLFLVQYSSLISWTTALITILFFAVDTMLPEAAANTYDYYDLQRTVDSTIYAIATLVILLPIYLWASSVLKKEHKETPERLTSPMRFWITYLALFIGLIVITVNLTKAIANLLSGELTIVIILKTMVVLIIVGGLMWIHGSTLRKQEE